MQEIKIFENTDFGAVRTMEIDGKIYFFASDIARCLGYSNPRKAINDHCKGVTKRSTPTDGGMQEVTANISGMKKWTSLQEWRKSVQLTSH